MLPAIAILGFFFEAFSVAERRIGRERELAADQAGASVTASRVMATALVKVHAYSAIWDDVQDAAVESLKEGRQVVNVSKTYAETVAQRATTTPFSGIAETHVSHPTDSHPTLSARLESLAVAMSSVEPAALLVAPSDAAVSLVPNAESIEQEISAAYQSVLASHLGITVETAASRGERPSPIKHCPRCRIKVLPTAEGLCPSCGLGM